jgi:hypothetical protein
VIGLEIDREGVADAKPFEDEHVQFREGGFEDAWAEMSKHLHPLGAIVDGTCDELGSLATWVEIPKSRPQSLTLSVRLKDLVDPLAIAERLQKILIPRNTPDHAVHGFIQDVQRSWQNATGIGLVKSRWSGAPSRPCPQVEIDSSRAYCVPHNLEKWGFDSQSQVASTALVEGTLSSLLTQTLQD